MSVREVLDTVEAMVAAAGDAVEHVEVDAKAFLELCDRMPRGHVLRKFADAHRGRERPLSIGRLTLREVLLANGHKLETKGDPGDQ